MPNPSTLSIQTIYEDNRDLLKLGWFAGCSGGDKLIFGDAISAADQVGHLNLIHPGRIQVMGHQEKAYYERISPNSRAHLFRDLITGGTPAIIVAQGLETPQDLMTVCDENNIPLFSTPMPSAQVIDFLRVFLSKRLAQQLTKHGVFMDVFGVGVLITGNSGLGKSELGLELISRGHGLVADDAVEFSRIAPNMVEGRCPQLFERLPIDEQTDEVLGLEVRKVTIPVAAGRNIAVLLEAAVRNTILKLRGINTLQEFMERQRKAMSEEGDE